MSTLTQAKREAIERYHEKTYKRIIVTLRYDEDMDIIESHKKSQESGATSREWLRELFENAQK